MTSIASSPSSSSMGLACLVCSPGGDAVADEEDPPPPMLSEFHLLYICFVVLGGQEMRAIHSIGGVVDAAVDRMVFLLLQEENSTNSAAFLSVLHLLNQMSNFAQAHEPVYRKSSILLRRILLTTTLDEGDRFVIRAKELSAEILRNLSRCPENKVSIYREMLETLFDCLLSGETLKVQRFALGALNNLATLDENAIALMRKPMFLETVLEFANRGGTSTIKERALWTLQSMACADENEILMFEKPHLIETLVDCLERGDTKEIKAYAIETLRNLSNRNQVQMFQNRKLVNALLFTMDYGESPALRNLALSCFQRMGVAKEHVHGFAVLTVLCSAREIPRVCQPGCTFQRIPRELVRAIGLAVWGGNHRS